MSKKLLCLVFALSIILTSTACGVDNKGVFDFITEATQITEESSSAASASQAETTEAGPPGDYTNAIDLESCFSGYPQQIVYLKNDVNAVVVDADVTNNIRKEGLNTNERLLAGTVLCPAYAETIADVVMNESVNFITYQGMAVHIATSVSDNGEVLFDGKSILDMFGGAFERIDEIAGNYQESTEIGEVILEPWETLDSHAFYNKLIIRIDWNQDGIEDEFCQINIGELSKTFTFTDGKTGAVTDLIALASIADSDNPESGHDETMGLVLDNTTLVCQNSKGEYGILCSYFYDDSGYISYAFQFDPDTLISSKGIGASFKYQDSQFYYHPYTSCLGNKWTLEQKVDLADDFTFTNFDDTKYYRQPPYDNLVVFTKTAVALDAVNEVNDESVELAPGTVILPDRLVTEADGMMYLYVRLVDGREGRFLCEGDESSKVTLNGIDQWTLFEGLVHK